MIYSRQRTRRAIRRKDDTLATGTIKTIRDDKGFGFVSPDGSNSRNDVFFHHSAVENNGFDLLREGQRISFDVEPDPRDPSRQRAVHVSPVDDEDEV